MNVVRGLGLAELGDREAPNGLSLRREDMGEEDRFASVLSRLIKSAGGEEVSLPADGDRPIRPAARPRDNRLSGPDGDEEIQDESIAGGAFKLHGVRQVEMLPAQSEAKEQLPPDVFEKDASVDAPEALVGAIHLPHRIERQLGMLTNRLEAKQEFLRESSEPSDLAVVPPANNEQATPARADLDLLAAPRATAEIGSPDLLPDTDDGGKPASQEPPVNANASPIAAAGNLRAPDLHEASLAEPAGELPARHEEMTDTERARAPGEAESELRPSPTGLPRVTVVSRETHFAPSERPDPVWPAVLPSDPRPDPPAGLANAETAGADVPPRQDRLAYTGSLLPDESGPQRSEIGTVRNLPAGSVPTGAGVTTSSAEHPVESPNGAARTGEGVSQRIVPPPEFSRAAVMSQEKPFAPARRPDPPGSALSNLQPDPAAADLRPELPRSPEGWPALSRPQALGAVPAAVDQPQLTAMPEPTLELAPRHERGRESLGVAAAATTPSLESTSAPVGSTIAPVFGAEVLQRISGAIVEAADSVALTATPAVAPAGVGNSPAASTPAQVLTIRIDLHEHGALHVRLALNGNALSLRVRADREETAEQLRQDHQQLSDTLSAAGYETEIVAIEGRKAEVAPLQGNDPGSPAGTGANDTANADRGTGGENRRSSSRQTQVPDRRFGEDLLPHDQEAHETRHIAQRRAGALYV